MKIHYSPSYDGDIFLGDAPQVMGETYVGNLGLMEQLQLRAGLHEEPKSDVEREADFHNAMIPWLKGTMFKKNAEIDPFGVAKKLLQWRDNLVMAGWDGTCPDPAAKKVKILADIEKDFQSHGVVDCWKKLQEFYAKQGPHTTDLEEIGVECPMSEVPYLIRQTLNSLSAKGIKVVERIKDTNPTPALDTTKVSLLEFEDVNEAYEWFATLRHLPENTAVINRDNVLLNHTLYTWNRPQQHSSLTDSNPQLLQLFKLSMNIFSRPLNLQNLVSYLQLPMSPIPLKLRKELAKLLLSQGGFGEKKLRDDGKIRDDWEEIIEQYEFLGKDGNDSPQAKGKAKANKMPFLVPIRKDYSAGIDKQGIVDYTENLKKWIQGFRADDNLPADRRAQLHELLTYLNSLSTALQPLSDTVEYKEVEKLILQIYQPMNYSLQEAEVGSRNIIPDIRSLAIGAQTLVWLDCQEEDIEINPYDFLSSKEKKYLESAGCQIPDFNQHLSTCRKERLRLLDKCQQIILVRSKFNGTTRLGEHSLISEAEHALGKKLEPSDPKALFTQEALTWSNPTDLDKMSPVPALELGTIDYPGRVESNTSLDMLINLPFNYLVQYVAKLPMPDEEQISNLFITTGQVAHYFFQHIIEDGNKDLNKMRELTEKEFDARLEAALDATGLIFRLPENAAQLAEFRKQLQDSMLALIEIMEQKNWEPVGCEITFPAQGELDLRTIGTFGARIDFLLKKGDQYVIVDFKWSYGKSFTEKLEKNQAIQLELYRQTVLATYPANKVLGVGYYLMPKKELITTDFDEIPNSKLIKKINPANTQDLFLQIQNSYKFRMDELKRGHIEEAELQDVLPDKTNYYHQEESKGMVPLHVTEKSEGRGNNRVILGEIKDSEKIFKPSKKIKFEDKNAEPSEIATSHPILKGRLK